MFGFRKSHSNTLALSEFVVGVLSNFNKRNAVCAVFLDLSKAFDSVDQCFPNSFFKSPPLESIKWEIAP